MSKPLQSAERVQDDDGRQYHIDLAPGEVAESIILVGDPARAHLVGSLFDSIELTRHHREFVSITGIHRGLRVTVMGTGMGGGCTEIAMIELAQCVDQATVIRCGSCGALQPEIGLGELVISQGACRLENTTLSYVEPGYPAVAHPEVVIALLQAAAHRGVKNHLGITATAPGFYAAQCRHAPGFGMREPDLVDRLARQGIANLEMEVSAILTLASLRSFRAGAVCAVYANRPHNTFIEPEARKQAELACVQTGLAALHIVAAMGEQRGQHSTWHPGHGSLHTVLPDSVQD